MNLKSIEMKFIFAMKLLTVGTTVLLLSSSCGTRQREEKPGTDSISFPKGSYGYDLAFLVRNKEVIELTDESGQSKVAIVGDYQARVMTSTARGDNGISYGWINYPLISGGKKLRHMNPYGGEDRLWLGPEGGPFALFFEPGKPFDYESWQTPPIMDTEPFVLQSADKRHASWSKNATLTNHQGTKLQVLMDREVRLLEPTEIKSLFGVQPGYLHHVCYQTANTVTNSGAEAWKQETGLPSIWILGMFNPSPSTTIIIPFRRRKDGKITDDYFGKIPADRLATSDSVVFFAADGKSRGKLGVPPALARNIMGSYDAARHVLTLVHLDLFPDQPYVNSKWEEQKDPFAGDAVNAYNDGPLANGDQLGPFYELESSSPALALKPGQKWTHRHTTLHVEGSEKELDELMQKSLGVSIQTMESALTKNK